MKWDAETPGVILLYSVPDTITCRSTLTSCRRVVKLLCSKLAEQMVSSQIGEVSFFLTDGHESAPATHTHTHSCGSQLLTSCRKGFLLLLLHTPTRIICCEVVVSDSFIWSFTHHHRIQPAVCLSLHLVSPQQMVSHLPLIFHPEIDLVWYKGKHQIFVNVSKVCLDLLKSHHDVIEQGLKRRSPVWVVCLDKKWKVDKRKP
jgi:hypothetical protein